MKTEFKWGDRVLVKDIDDNVWSERIFLQEIKGSQNPYVTVNGYYEPEFLKGEPFRTITYAQIKPLEKELPQNWEDLKTTTGYVIDIHSNIRHIGLSLEKDYKLDKSDRNIFATKEQAEAAIAMAQLSQLMKVYNDGWMPDWTDKEETKYIIFFYEDNITTAKSIVSNHFLRFKTEKLRDKFLENFRDLIEQAKPLL